MNNRVVVFTLLGLILVGVAEWDIHKQVLSPVRKLDRFWVDFCLGNTGEKIGKPSITMVRIPENYEPITVAKEEGANLGNQSADELSRLDYATFLYSLAKLNPRSISFLPTPVFSNPSPFNATDINPLRDAALQLPKMTLATVVSSEAAPAKDSGQAVNYAAIPAKGDTSLVPEIIGTTVSADPDLLVNGDPAFFVFEGQKPAFSPGKNPEVQLVARQGNRMVAGFILASVARHAGVGMEQISIDLETTRPFIQVGDRYKIPVSRSGAMELPSHAGLSHSMYDITSRDESGKENRQYHFAQLEVGETALPSIESDIVVKNVVDKVLAGKLQSISENLVLLGFDRTSERTLPTRNDEWLSPLSLTARAIATIQSGRHTTVWPLWARTATYFGILLLGAILLSLRKFAIPFTIAAILLGLVTLVFIFKLTLSWTPPAAIFGLVSLMILTGLFIRRRPQLAPAE